MSAGIFASLSQSYWSSARNALYFVGRSNWMMKLVTFPVALVYSILLLPVGLVFALLIVFDWVGKVTNAIRKTILDWMGQQSWNVDNSFMDFLLRPVVLVALAPLFLLSVFIPKVSSDVLVNMSINEASDIMSGAGSFRRINGIIWRAAHRLFLYVAQAPLLLKPVVAVIAIVYSIVLIAVGAVFALLVPLDWVSRLIEGMRQGVARFADNQQYKIRYSLGAFLFTPLVLLVLAPVFLAVILVPKFSTNIDVEV